MNSFLLTFFEYNHRANQSYIRSLSQIEHPDEQSLSLMSHVLNPHTIWMDRLSGLSGFRLYFSSTGKG